MPRRPTLTARRQRRAADHLADLALTAPQVVLHRLGRMARHGNRLGARDRAELRQMVDEKMVAGTHAMQAAWLAGMQASADFWLRALRGAWTPFLRPPTPAATLAAWQRAGEKMAAASLAPVARKARANLKRLERAGARNGRGPRSR